MALIDRHRVSQLITLTALEQTLQGPERLLREEDVAILIKAAYDDATAAARAAFMERVKDYPESKWPWSAVEVAKPPQGKGGGGGIVIVAVPSGPKTPAALILILGQADSPDADPGNRLPERTSAEGAEWEPLYKAFDTWSVSTIQKYIAPGGWMTPGGKVPFEEPQDGDTSGAPPNDVGKGPDTGQNGNNGDGNGNSNGQDGPIATQPAESGVPQWVWGLAIAGGTALVVGTTVALLRRPAPPTQSPLEQELLRQQGGGGR